jgi:hypothetical protein
MEGKRKLIVVGFTTKTHPSKVPLSLYVPKPQKKRSIFFVKLHLYTPTVSKGKITIERINITAFFVGTEL